MIILVQSLILFLKHICALHFFHSFKHSYTSHIIFKLFFVITFSSQCALHYSFSSLACIYARTLVSIRKSSTTSSRYNIKHSISKLYHIHVMHIHLASTSMSVKRTIFVRNNSKCSKYFALNIGTII